MKLKWMFTLLMLIILVGCAVEENGDETPKEQPENAPISSEVFEKEENNIEEIAVEEKEVEQDETRKLNFFKDSFKEGVFQAELVEPGLPAELGEKAEKIMLEIEAALNDNYDWYLETLQDLVKGEDLPYDKKLGITEEEYEFYLNIDEHMELVKLDNYEVEVEWKGNELNIHIPDSKIINTYRFSENGEKIYTELGEFTYKEDFVATDDQKITGRWNGFFYRVVGDNTQLLQVSIGKLEENDEVIIYTELLKQNEESQIEVVKY